ncbi:acetoacetate decarboxylase family protein [Gordonia sp. TBRC 11910]|uniref:Acetoacetate decarboxylase family protein n=1 Tax=Gordonia asplenii TaxID=2725283 RepID=A0A848KP73_9ACTN|nr:acetoacetate decarboxylase family protein [Gordonia asplenii]NMO00100.1 acetoacetate decarboxylase family protein [Gordonia asplenii]
MPVQIRDARCFVAAFTADARAVATAIAHTGLTPLRIRPGLTGAGRTMCMLVFVDYIDGDLGPYNEFGVCFLVDSPDDAASDRSALRSLIAGDARALVHHLPVDGEFTLAAGRGIWGFPKTLAEFSVTHDAETKHGVVHQDGRLVVDLKVRKGIPVPDSPSSDDVVLHAYSHLDGVTRSTDWRLSATSGTRSRIGGAALKLGSGPIADELRALKLSRHALLASSVDHLAMTFEEPEIITPSR